ncbi:type I-E CRISPR-associated protein Cse2/CasB [Streptomyces sp. SCUT-3]|uniref:type I-E CRISPR-associated protein Cse2/CasB n=1 Tax=Streptomyces sp. SCUT-3 TaxID=2684469 RepID=UPI000CB59B50|nr:type I-E CRISPR-associated protein Cse2/CasB [Streptomyces sp. SCUT-3]PLW66311.1 type I-E CRISPR-associated protein Cse2/CasB [Streptomyces sp. DJ]QMV20806.1 type I-E CRISPR-associated protein Cse2/CasB [Streptomyces sp. SCUT-3]
MSASVGGPRTGRRAYFWEEAADDRRTRAREGRPGFSENITRMLRGLRDGIGNEPGTVAAMRYAHRVELTDAERASDRLPAPYVAEHAALTLFGRHQQGAEPVHRPGTGLGRACQALRRAETLSESAVERRLIAAATAQDLHELVQHLYRLVPLLRQSGIGLDYTRLMHDLATWEGPHQGRVLRSWGLQYGDPSAPGDAPDRQAETLPYWARFDPDRPENGGQLAALRSGAGREAGTVPAMWPYYTTRMPSELRDKGALTRDLVAEHTALTLFGRHQQGRSRAVHVPGNSPGTAARLLQVRSGSGEEALERRFGALLTSTDTGELAMHLRGFVTMLSRADIGLDYDLLRTALRTWDDPELPYAQGRFRDHWDRDFRVGTMSTNS